MILFLLNLDFKIAESRLLGKCLQVTTTPFYRSDYPNYAVLPREKNVKRFVIRPYFAAGVKTQSFNLWIRQKC